MKDLAAIAAQLDAALIAAESSTINNTGWFTAAELAAEWKCSPRTAACKLKRLVSAGVVECERRRMVRHDGVIQRYAMYRFIEK
jgi:predicted transcriptional regulator